MSKMKIAAALLGGLVASANGGAAQAATITYAALTNGETSVSTLGFNVTASGGVFDSKTIDGVSGVGIASPNSTNSVVPGEIDGGNEVAESIAFQAIGAQLLNSFTVAFLYPTGVFGDGPNEVARIVINGTAYFLSVTGTGTAEFSSGIGTVIPGNSGGGEWTVSFLNPFLLQSIEFSPGNGGPDAALGDYAFNQLTTSPVPGPIVGAGLPGLIMALGGLVLLSRRRRSQAALA